MVKKNRSKSRVIDAEKAVELYNQAVIFHQNNQLSKSESAYRTALKLNPQFAEAHNNLGNVLKDQGRLKEALSEYRKAIKIYSDHPILLNNIGNTLLDLGDITQAIQYLNNAIEFANDYVDPLNNLANAYRSLCKFEEAVNTYIKAIEIDPKIADIHYNLASLLAYLGKTEQSVTYYKNTLRLDPDNVAAASALHHQLRNLCDWSELDELQKLIDGILAATISQNSDDLGSPFLAVTRTDELAQNYMIAKASSRKIVSSLACPPGKFLFAKRKVQKERLKIGYLSDDFCDHAVMHLLSGVLREHDKERVEIVCYSYGGFDESIYRQQAIQHSDQFVDISNINDYEAAQKIFTNKVDILVDLKGHTKDSRLGICAYRPAPVQTTFLGYPGTTGADFFDYLLTDKIVTPLEHQAYYSETFVWLPDTYLPCDNRQAISDVQVSKKDAGLPNDGIVFCSFNQPYKMDPITFDVWARLLQKIKASVIWLPKSNETVVNNLKCEMRARGADPCRLVFAEKTATKAQHLARMRLADLALDTRIYNGHTTTIDALWAGVPVITMQGRHFASRVSSSLLHAIGLPELVTADLAGYESLALRLASNCNELDTIREKLRLNRSSAPLFDTERFTRNLETAYEMMWQRYIAGQKADHFEVVNPN